MKILRQLIESKFEIFESGIFENRKNLNIANFEIKKNKKILDEKLNEKDFNVLKDSVVLLPKLTQIQDHKKFIDEKIN